MSRISPLAPVVLLLAVTACSGGRRPSGERAPDADVGLDIAGIEPKRAELRFAVATMLSPASTYKAYEGLLRHLSRELGRPYRFVQRRTHQEINELLLTGQIDLAFMCSGAYAALPPDAALEIVVVPVSRGTIRHRSLVLVRADSRFESFRDLEGARFAFTDPLSATGYIYPLYRAAAMGKNLDTFFGSTIFSGANDRALLAVERGLVDAAAVDDHVYARLVTPESPYWRRLRIIDTSDDFSVPPVVAPRSVPAELRARLRQLLLAESATAEGRARLAKIGLDGFASPEGAEYGAIRRMREVVTAKAR